MKQLISAGAKAEFKDRTGNTLVHLAAMFNRMDMVEFLYKHGADLNVKNPDGETSYDLAPPALASKMRAMVAANGGGARVSPPVTPTGGGGGASGSSSPAAVAASES